MNTTFALGIDVGGTTVTAGLVTPAGEILGGETITFDPRSDSSAEVILDTMAANLAPLVAKGPVAVAFGFPGPFDYENGVSLITGLSKYEALYGIHVGDALRTRLPALERIPVTFINDAEAYGVGEARFGAAKGSRRAVVLTIGTGCGSAFLVDGRIVRDGEGVPPNGWVYNLPFRGGMIDDFLSKRGIVRLWKELGGGDASEGVEPTVAQLAERAYRGEALPRRLFELFGEAAGDALSGVLKAFAADVIVLGGQISKSSSLFAPALTAKLESNRVACRVAQAQNIDLAAVIGAASAGFDLWNAGRA